MTLIKLCSFQNNSTKKYRLLCLESRNEAWCLWETSSDHDYLPDLRADKLACTVYQFGRPATFADYEQKRDQIVANGYTIVGQQ
jgi:hypothetical protein